MTKSQKLFNWCTLLVLVLIFSTGACVMLFVGAVLAPTYPVLGVAMMVTGGASFAAALASLQMMEHYV